MACYADRRQAGRYLASLLLEYGGRPDVVVLALPRGGLPVGHEVARRLRAPLDILTVRRLTVPGHEQLEMGALAAGGDPVLDDEVVDALGIPGDVIEAVASDARRAIEGREGVFRGGLPAIDVARRTVILVDDGRSTGSAMRAAVKAAEQQGAEEVVVAAPIGARAALAEVAAIADEVVCPATPEPFLGASLWYDDFPEISDDEVRDILTAAAEEHARPLSPLDRHGVAGASGPRPA